MAVETAEKCCQANTQFAEISEVRRREERMHNTSRPAQKYVFVIESYSLHVGKGIGVSGLASISKLLQRLKL